MPINSGYGQSHLKVETGASLAAGLRKKGGLHPYRHRRPRCLLDARHARHTLEVAFRHRSAAHVVRKDVMAANGNGPSTATMPAG